MADRNCKDCLFSEIVRFGEGHQAQKCAYPVPEWVKIHSGGGFLNGHEAQSCQLYKTKADLIQSVSVPHETTDPNEHEK